MRLCWVGRQIAGWGVQTSNTEGKWREQNTATYSHYLGVLTLDRKVQCRLLVNVLYVQIGISLGREKEQINRLTSEK